MAGWYPGKNIVSGIKQVGHGIMDRRRDRQELQQRATGPAGPAPQIAGAQGMLGADRAAQGNALGMFGEAAAGNTPSMAELQGQQMMGQAVTDQMGMLAQGRGGSMAATARAAQGMGAAGQMASAQQSAQLRAQEMDAARQAYAGQANTMAGLSGGMVGQNADMATQWGLGQRGMDLQALQGQQQNRLGWADRIIGAGAGAGQLAMFSDERLKTDIRPAGDTAGDTLASLEPIGYRYKDKRHGDDEEETIGFTAQDLEKTPMGKRLVKEVPGEGKAVDVPGMLSLLTAWAAGKEQRDRREAR